MLEIKQQLSDRLSKKSLIRLLVDERFFLMDLGGRLSRWGDD
ncbi:MAG: hypothetical protein Q4B81_08600 [Moraxella sp.]|nr:hypothetical protein [Moraxella sp.]